METAGRKIVGIGETVLDIVFRNGQPQAAVPGGSVFNAMVSLGRTVGRMQPGVQLVMASQMGDDAVAGMMTDFMRRNRLDTAWIQQDPGQSTVSLALLDAGSNARYEFFRDPGLPAFRTPQIPFLRWNGSFLRSVRGTISMRASSAPWCAEALPASAWSGSAPPTGSGSSPRRCASLQRSAEVYRIMCRKNSASRTGV